MKKIFLLLIFLLPFFYGCNLKWWEKIADMHQLNTIAIQAYKQWSYQQALKLFDRILQKYPWAKEVYYNRWLVYFSLEQYQQALSSFDEALMIDETYIDALVNKAWTLSTLWKYNEALKIFDQALLEDPSNKYALNNEGYAWYELWEKQNALDLYNHALAQDAHFAEALLNKAIVMAEMGSGEESLAYFDQAIASASGGFLNYYNKAIVLSDLVHQLENKQDNTSQLKAERYAHEALDVLDKALILKPWDLDALMYQAIIYYNMGKYPSCLQVINKILDKNPEYEDAWYYKEKCENN